MLQLCGIVLLSLVSTGYAEYLEGIAISGGGGDSSRSVEVYQPSTGYSCSLPDLPDDRFGHTMDTDSLYICGGWLTASTCLHFSSGMWSISHTLVQERAYHSSWEREVGLVLVGGSDSDCTEIVPVTEGQQGGTYFTMKYHTGLACGIPDLSTDSLVMTGGKFTRHLVSRYDSLGWVEDLPPLVEGRGDHACGSYVRLDGAQVLLVAGGFDVDNNQRLASTEVFTEESNRWKLTNPLPRALEGFSGVTLGNIVYIIGGFDNSSRDEILAWNDASQEWKQNGRMQVPRMFPAATTVKLVDEIINYCV